MTRGKKSRLVAFGKVGSVSVPRTDFIVIVPLWSQQGFRALLTDATHTVPSAAS